GFDMVGGEKAALQVIQEKIHFTAIFAVNDLVAIGASEVLIRQGLRVPEDVSVVGYGDLSVGRYYRVPLTTVHQPTADLGVGAVRAVWELLEKIRPETRRLPVDLVIRRSSVAPGGK
ncbi:MAG: substrate-binding domain-containing protein, partial [Verrucomicrobiae bacterium]|nr:substrate-binding domain-containing protein [Verrucomicrobiae bacterium]